MKSIPREKQRHAERERGQLELSPTRGNSCHRPAIHLNGNEWATRKVQSLTYMILKGLTAGPFVVSAGNMNLLLSECDAMRDSDPTVIGSR